jgi:hypothetical protein
MTGAETPLLKCIAERLVRCSAFAGRGPLASRAFRVAGKLKAAMRRAFSAGGLSNGIPWGVAPGWQ